MNRFSDWVIRDAAHAEANLRKNVPRIGNDPWYRRRFIALMAVTMSAYVPVPPLLVTGHYVIAGACFVVGVTVNQAGGYWLNKRAAARDVQP